ncbi:Protein of unknown function [Evansella caseinilytica]|uniref:DUF3231 family protein n=1 Tax=Evansella caseinilytica TaxID=1503961 RepID=A0A1H3S7X6_9BACI|nr:DUF3231 family protein [Evansella caseinilytica]SDZ33239.1 Protein of unknown function [Evansella caseinilytica]
MANPLEAVWNALKLAIDNADEPTSPLHVIEVGDCWRYLTMVEEFIRFEETGLNTSTDDEIKEMLVDIVRICEGQVKLLGEFMKKEGIPLPDVTSAKPDSDPKDVPLGVKLTDAEISNGIVFKLVICMQTCAHAQANAVRNDVGMMWIRFYTEWITFGSTLKTLMRKRGWIKVPPYYYPPGSPVQ